MPVVHQRKTAREKEAALTATTIGALSVSDALAIQIEMAYYEHSLLRALGETSLVTLEAILTQAAAMPASVLEAELFVGKTDRSLRPNPKARSMRRRGARYTVRKDHGTKVFYQEIAETNAARGGRKHGSNAQRRKQTKLVKRSGNPAIITKLIRSGDLLL